MDNAARITSSTRGSASRAAATAMAIMRPPIVSRPRGCRRTEAFMVLTGDFRF
ncbi:MAG: hypothetical protein ACLQVF_08845 [Isosphaeraceae bacterium]